MNNLQTQYSQATPWVEKYRPQSAKEMAGFDEIIKDLKEFITNFFKYQKQIKNFRKNLPKVNDPLQKKKIALKLKSIQARFDKHKASMLIGPPGVGKTTVVYALAKDLNLSVIELNASDTRTKDALEEKLQETVKSTNLLSFTQQKKKDKLILIDEVDGIHGRKDRGGVPTLKKIIGYSRFPIIMTCNFRDERKFGSLYKLAQPLIEVSPAKPDEIARILFKIAQAENIEITQDQLKQLATKTNGDFRSAINDLQGLAQGGHNIDKTALKKVNMNRDSDISVKDMMSDLFHASSIREAKKVLDEVQNNQIDFNNIHKWLNENIIYYINKKLEILFAYKHLAHADRILGYIGRTQEYKHLSYFFDILAGGIRFSKHDKKIPTRDVKPPKWFRTRAIPDDEMAKKLQELYSVSLKTVMQEIRPNLSMMVELNEKINNYIGQILNVTPKKVKSTLKT